MHIFFMYVGNLVFVGVYLLVTHKRANNISLYVYMHVCMYICVGILHQNFNRSISIRAYIVRSIFLLNEYKRI